VKSRTKLKHRYVGMDVHKEDISLCVFDDEQYQPTFVKRILNDRVKIKREIGKLKAEKYELHTCYEAGPCGYELKRLLDEMKIECWVIAPGLVPRRPTDRVKTDRRDAEKLARMLRAGEISPIHVPTPETESVRDLVRCREDLRCEYRRARQRLSLFLLRNGRTYPGTPWTHAHRLWLKSIEWSLPALKETFETYLYFVMHIEEKLSHCDQTIEEYSKRDPMKKPVEILRCFKGIDTLTAMGLVTEVEDFRRFPSARSFMSYLGLVVSENSSGGHRKRGGITKTGNGHLRRLLIESAWSYRHRPIVGRPLSQRRIGKPQWIIHMADKAMNRLYKRFHRLSSRNKRIQIVVTAVARELAGFIWASQVHEEAV